MPDQKLFGAFYSSKEINTVMGLRCLFGCDSTRSLFRFPTLAWLRVKWLEFTHFEESAINASSRLCHRHFSKYCFTNFEMVAAGFAVNLQLSATAVPTIYTVGASSSPSRPATKDVGCQCDPSRSSFGTQVRQAMKLRRSKAIQVNPVAKRESTMSDVCGKIFDSSVCTSMPIKRQRRKDISFSPFSSPASSSSTQPDSTFLPDDTGKTTMLHSDRLTDISTSKS
nr:uncharacterized protein LOC548339 isoform X2 [Danio rerio]|eukprot:XP_021336692.1 uncharacterized protein LOC548339 isoform X2 [Danio rerio]